MLNKYNVFFLNLENKLFFYENKRCQVYAFEKKMQIKATGIDFVT